MGRSWIGAFGSPESVFENCGSAILADVEPGFQPGGVGHAKQEQQVKWRGNDLGDVSGRQDAALYGRPGGLPLLFKTASEASPTE